MARIRQADVDEVKARTNIGDIIGERVALKSAGVGSLKGLCPLVHGAQERVHVARLAASEAVVVADLGSDVEAGAALVVEGTQTMDHLTFTEAVERLAGRIGYALHYEDGGAAPETSGRTRLYQANAAAADWFRARSPSQPFGA
jgi:DNA primase